MRCHYCGVMTRTKCGPSHPHLRTRDHVIPMSRGGRKHVWVTLAEWRLVLSLRYRTLCVFAFERARIRVIFTTWMRFLPAI